MDGSGYAQVKEVAMPDSDSEMWLQRLEEALSGIRDAPDAPTLDVEWLLLRCQDTRRMTGQLRVASTEQLRKDVASFVAQFPGLLPDALASPV